MKSRIDLVHLRQDLEIEEAAADRYARRVDLGGVDGAAAASDRMNRDWHEARARKIRRRILTLRETQID